jgi:micrococcal nuclease
VLGAIPLLVASSLLAASSLLVACGRSAGPTGAGGARVVRVVDGDTIVVSSEGEEERVRLIGIDTPESVKPGTPVECFGKEASAHLADLLPEGTQVRLERDVEARDRYERLLAYVYRSSDDLFVNKAMVDDGYAQPVTYPPNVAHTDELVAAGRKAREDDLGLWSACGGDDPFG